MNAKCLHCMHLAFLLNVHLLPFLVSIIFPFLLGASARTQLALQIHTTISLYSDIIQDVIFLFYMRIHHKRPPASQYTI